MKSYSLSHALKLWRKSKEAKNIDANFEKYLSIALRLYVIPELDPNAQRIKAKQFGAYCNDFPVAKLKEALDLFDQQTRNAIEVKQISQGTSENYRCALKRFLEWLEKQVWWCELFPQPITNQDVAPFRVHAAPKPSCKRLSPYGLKRDELPEHLVQELEAFKQFRLTGGKNLRHSVLERRRRREEGTITKPRINSIKLSTFRKDEDVILCFLGWYAQEYPNSELHLELLNEPVLLDDYTYWATETRGVSHSTGVKLTDAAIAVAKWLNYEKSARRSWSDIPIVLELQDLRNEYAEIYEQEKKQHTAEKWLFKKLTHEQARQVVQYLKTLCAPNYGRHDKETGEFLSHGIRPNSAIARAWQTYLIVNILVYCPIRQEEIRNFILNKTLFRKKDEQGIPYYVAKFWEHKRSSITGKPRHYRLPAILTEDIDLWVYKWRPLIEESVKTLDGWKEFWGYGSGKAERICQRVEAARQGIVGDKVTVSIDRYIQQEEVRLQGAENRIATWETAKENFESHNYLFFMFSKGEPESFGKPHNITSVWQMVSRAIANATQALFGEARWTNPHALRHIAEKHVRQMGKAHITEAFGTLIGHSKEMGDEYAEQITSEYELTEGIVDNWWE